MAQVSYDKLIHNEKYKEQLKLICDTYKFKEIYGKKILITGASGLIGSSVVDVIYMLNELFEAGIFLYICGRSVAGLKKRFPYLENNRSEFVIYDALSPISIEESIDFVIHAASPASPNEYVTTPVQTIMTNIMGTNNLLELVRKQGYGRLVYVSSSEAYGIDNNEKLIESNTLSTFDLCRTRSSYPASKALAELLVKSYVEQYDINACAVRPGYIFGPTARETDIRVSSQFAYMAANGEEIVLKSDGSQVRSYCYCLDCASAILSVLIRGIKGEMYNISNNYSYMSIREVADIYACSGNVNVKFEAPSESEKKAFNKITESILDSSKLMNEGWKCVFDNRNALFDTVSILKSSFSME